LDAPIDIPRDLTPSVAFIQSRIPSKHPSTAVLGEERVGAGVAVEADRVLTAHYLVLGASEVEVTFVDGKSRSVRRVATDHETGLALLFLDGVPVKNVPLGRAESVQPGLPVFLLTATGASERKGSTGHVFRVEPFEAFWEYMLDRAILTTAINPGLAGAPLFDLRGRLLGLVSLGLVAVGRHTLAIPVDLFLAHREELEGERPRAAPRAWVGFYPQACDGSVVLTGVVPNGPAEQAGLAKGDFILSANGEPVSSLRELYVEIWRHAPGDRLGFQILRDSSIRVVEVVAGERALFYK
jgi:S1-C subfamily serine protease